MKNIIIAQTQGKSVAVGDNSFATIKKTGEGNFLASLEVLKEILSAIPVEPSETVHIYLPDMLQGITTGSAIEYVKTGKTGSGKDLSAEEIEGFKSFYAMYAERILNIRISLSKYIKKDATALLSLRNNAWKTVNSFNAGVSNTAVQTTIVDPNAELKAMIDKQILEALTAGNMEQVMTLTTYKNSLPAPTVVANTVSTTSSVVSSGSEIAMPSFDDEADQSFANANDSEEEGEAVDENGNPIVFDEEVIAGSEQAAW